MPQPPSAAFVDEFSSTATLLAQQTQSRFSGKVRTTSQKARSKYYEQIGATVALKVTSRNPDTPNIQQDQQRRATFLTPYVWATLVDKPDMQEMLIDAPAEFLRAGMAAFARAKDLEVITAATGTAYADTGSGNGVTSPVTLPAAQQIAVNYQSPAVPASGPNTGLTLAKLERANSLLEQAEFPEGSRKFFALKQQGIDNLLLNVPQVASTFTSNTKALQDGTLGGYMGFEFIKTQLLSTTSNVTTSFAFYEDALILATGYDVNSRLDVRIDKQMAWQPYIDMMIGATRLQDNGVVAVFTDDTTAA
jgi:hypothetical protein